VLTPVAVNEVARLFIAVLSQLADQAQLGQGVFLYFILELAILVAMLELVDPVMLG
jgi:hypothetical protein